MPEPGLDADPLEFDFASAETGDNAVALGYPLDDEQPTSDGGRVQQFERGTLTWHPSGVTRQLTKEA